MDTYCLTCHGKTDPEADLDLSNFTSFTSVVDGYAHWELVLERLEEGDMPPKKAKAHPTSDLRKEIVAWIHAVKENEAQKNAGDPGPVLARRLSNAEYDYTIRDLTGFDIRPTKEFPVDPANQAGFDNSGESLTMSPALLKKYLQAARTVAEHLVLQPDGFTFAPHPVLADTDRDKYSVLKIVEFYKQQPTDFADYFVAAWHYQHRAKFGNRGATLASVAAQQKVSAKYLQAIWAALNDTKEKVGPMARLQTMFRELPAPKGANSSGETVRQAAAAMRDYVVHIREKIVPDVPNLTAPPIERGSQTLVMWKNRQMAANRRRFDPKALQVEGLPSPDEKSAAAATAGAPAPVQGTAAMPAASPGTEQKAAPATPAPSAPAVAASPAPAGAAAPHATARAATDAVLAATAPTAAAAAAADAPVIPGKPTATPTPARPPQTPDVIRTGGKFLAPAITTTGSSATFKMAASKKREADPDLVVPADPVKRAAFEASFAKFASLFPDAFYITERARVYLDAEREQKNAGRLLSAGLHSMTGYFRDDGPLYDLILDEKGQRELDRMWQEFDYYAQIPVRMHTSFVWFERTDSGFMRDPEFDPYRPEDKSVTTLEKINKLSELYLAKAQRNKASEAAQQAIKEHFERVHANMAWMEQTRQKAEPTHLTALESFAERAYRRPLSPQEREGLRRFYKASREENGVDHEEAMRDCIVSVLMSPHFCYRVDLVEVAGSVASTAQSKPVFAGARKQEKPAPSATAGLRPGTMLLSDYALASRLSYFLWSSIPDAELLARAAAGDLRRPEVLAAQAKRMLKDPRIRNLATEFEGHWLDFRRFEEHNSVDRERFPTFDNDLRKAMFEEPIRFFVDIVANDRSVLNFVYGDYTFVNPPLAKHYGMPDVAGTLDTWIRFDRAGDYGRGGLLPMSVFLTANSPGLRTSPVKRGYWVVRRVLGERIPPPPAVVPDLPNDEKNMGDLTLREVLAKHREDASCASCHARFDSYGLVFENYGPVGERRTTDFGGRPVDVRAPFPGGTERSGLAGLRDYVREHREGDFVDNFCRKLLSYSLGRTLLASDEMLVRDMRAKLAANHHRFSTLVDCIVTSPQFRSKRVPPVTASEPAKTASVR